MRGVGSERDCEGDVAGSGSDARCWCGARLRGRCGWERERCEVLVRSAIARAMRERCEVLGRSAMTRAMW